MAKKQQEQQEEQESTDKEESKFVPVDAYNSLQAKASSEAQARKELEARLAQLEADRKANEEEELRQRQEFEKLWKKEKEEKEALAKRFQQNDQLYKDSIKKSHLKEALGGKIKDQYLDFADISKIELDERGLPTVESLKMVEEKFREEHSQLIPKSSGPDPGDIPPGVGPGKPDRNLESAMTSREAFYELIKPILTKK